jgi:hypothetical protein
MRSFFETHKNGALTEYFRLSCRKGVLRTLGIGLWSATVPANRQLDTIYCKIFLAVCRDLGIVKVFTTACHPQTNGQVERFNRTILNALRGYVPSNQRDWDEYTSTITFGYNCRVHASLGFTPFEITLARPPPPLSVEFLRKREADTPEIFRLRFFHRLKELLPLARSRLAESQAR